MTLALGGLAEDRDPGGIIVVADSRSQAEVLYKNRGEIVKYLSIHGFFEKAYVFAASYGAETIDAKTIVRICSNLLENGNWTGNREMTCMLYSAFVRGKYNETGLKYLIIKEN